MRAGWSSTKLYGMGRGCLLAALIAGLAACAPPSPPPVVQGQRPAEFPEAHYWQARQQGRTVLRVDPRHSLVSIQVGRAGSLARLGHDHVIASHDLQGYVAPEEGRADLWFSLDRLVVDEPALRTAAGLDTQPSPDAIEGTRRNMLDKVLEAERFPFILINARRRDADHLKVSITLHGQTREWDIPARMEARPGGMAVSGQLVVNQTDFGIVPFAVLGGALQVRDRLDLHFWIIANTL